MGSEEYREWRSSIRPDEITESSKVAGSYKVWCNLRQCTCKFIPTNVNNVSSHEYVGLGCSSSCRKTTRR